MTIWRLANDTPCVAWPWLEFVPTFVALGELHLAVRIHCLAFHGIGPAAFLMGFGIVVLPGSCPERCPYSRCGLETVINAAKVGGGLNKA